MKKILAAAFAAIIGLSAFAQEKEAVTALSFGIGFPQISAEIDGESSKFSGYTFSFQDHIVKPNGMVFIFGADIGAVSTSDFGEDDQTGFFLGFDVGLGYALVSNEKFLLSLGGVVGWDITTFSYEESGDGYSVKADTMAYNFNIGADLFATFKFSQKVGLFADMKLMYKIGYATVDSTVKISGYGSSSDRGSYSMSGTLFKPSFGLSIML